MEWTDELVIEFANKATGYNALANALSLPSIASKLNEFKEEKMFYETYENKWVKFTRTNYLSYYQDHGSHVNIPWETEFEISFNRTQEQVHLTSRGYGILSEDIHAYGNGKLIISKSTLMKAIKENLCEILPA